MNCRGCGSENLWSFLDLGNQALPRFPEKPDEEVPHYPLELVKCEACHLVQLSESVDRDLLFRKFWYQSGISSSIRIDLEGIAREGVKEANLKEADIVIDIGCNDGTLLSHLPGTVRKVGFEPAFNLALAAKKYGFVFTDYFRAFRYLDRFKQKAKLITAIAMFYDLEDPTRFCQEVSHCLADNGVFIVQQNYLGLMLVNTAYDNVCHEHLTYFSLASMNNVLNRAGLEIYHVELNHINGGSFKTFIGFLGSHKQDDSVKMLELAEQKQNLQGHKVYRDFAYRVRTKGRRLNRFLSTHGSTMIYGAGSRGATLFQYATLIKPEIVAAVDKNPEKQGRYYLDTRIPIISREEALKDPPNYFLILPSHLSDEIIDAEKEAFPKTRWVIPLPEFRVR